MIIMIIIIIIIGIVADYLSSTVAPHSLSRFDIRITDASALRHDVIKKLFAIRLYGNLYDS